MPKQQQQPPQLKTSGKSTLTIVQAVNAALRQEMERDPTVVVLGEDVGRDGGVFRCTEGLLNRFGPQRVMDTPLSESGIVGTSIGMAVNGLKPVAEIQFEGFLYPAIDQLINHAARIRTRSRGRYHVPMVVRAPYCGGIRALEHHSDSPETYFIHTPGLKVVIPSNPYDTKGLLISAIRDPDTVIFLEPKRIYRAVKQEVPDGEYTIPLGKAHIVREGTDITLIAYGAMVRECATAAAQVEDQVSIEVIDIRTLSPLDTETILASVKKTGRAIVVHEAPRTCGFGAEIAAYIQENVLLNLQAPVMRVTGYDVIMPLARSEDYYLPNAAKIIKAIEKILNF